MTAIPITFGLRWTSPQEANQYLEEHRKKMGKGPKQPQEAKTTQDPGPESILQLKCEAWLKERGYPYIHDRSRKKNTAGDILDLHIYLPKGRHVVIELKAKGNKMTPEQKETYKKIMFLGHEVYECRSFKRFLEIMESR